MFVCSTFFRLRVKKEDKETLKKFVLLFLSKESKHASGDKQWIAWFCSTISSGIYHVSGKSAVTSEKLLSS